MTDASRWLHATQPGTREVPRPTGRSPLRTAWLHYPGDGLHFIQAPTPGGHAFLETPEAGGHAFMLCPTSPNISPGYLLRNPRNPTPSGGDATPCSRPPLCPRLSVGPVLLYAELFIASQTDLTGVADAFRSTYPTARPPLDLDPGKLVKNYATNIYPIPVEGQTRCNGLWADLISHGLGALAETMVLAAQDRSFRSVTGLPASPRHQQTLVERVRALAEAPGSPNARLA